jgi:integrase
MKKVLTDRLVNSLKPAAPGRRYDVMDTVVPGFGVRVTAKGSRTYILFARLPGARQRTRRAIAPVGAVSLVAARDTARKWHGQVVAGIDPKQTAADQARAVVVAREGAFETVAEEFIKRALVGQRKGPEVARNIRNEFVSQWKGRPIADIKRDDVVKILERVTDRGAMYQAHNLLGDISRLFDWAIMRGRYGLENSPCDRLKPSKIIGKKTARDRTLDDDELRKLWNAAPTLGYPHGPVYQLLILTGLRLNEVADAAWSEIDLLKRLWTIPGKRMKGGLTHVVPLCDQTAAVLADLPRWNQGEFLFSTTSGEKPVYVSDKIKKRLNLLVGFADWKNQDIRRTVRTNLSRLPIEEHVRELMIAHTRKGIAGVYDHHSYLDEKRAGFELWCRRLATIVNRANGG